MTFQVHFLCFFHNSKIFQTLFLKLKFLRKIVLLTNDLTSKLIKNNQKWICVLYVYTCVCFYVYVHVCIYVYVYACVRVCVYKYVRMYLYACIRLKISSKRVKARAIPCPHQPPVRDDSTVSVAQGGIATPGATKQLLPPDRVLRELYIHIYIYARSIKSRDYIGR